jgi:hypothetical protein
VGGKIGVDTGYNIIHHNMDGAPFSLKERRRKWFSNIKDTEKNERKEDKKQVALVNGSNKGNPLTGNFIYDHKARVRLM